MSGIFRPATFVGLALGWLFSSLFITDFSESDGVVVFVLLVLAAVSYYVNE